MTSYKKFLPEHSEQLLVLHGGDVVGQVEDRLLPVCVGGFGGGRETNTLMTFGELNLKKCHQGLKNRIKITYKKMGSQSIENALMTFEEFNVKKCHLRLKKLI